MVFVVFVKKKVFMIFNEIADKFNKVIEHSQGFTPRTTNKLLEQWHNNKKPYINLFNGQYIYEYGKVKIEMTHALKRKAFDNFIKGLNAYPRLAAFVCYQGYTSFYTNKTEYRYDAGEEVIPEGSKLLKAFKYFITDKETLRTIQDEASMIIQQKYLEGILCLSVHPLDYLSLSENTYNWRSCHALDGDYRAGNISYMLDNSTVVCYLKSEEDVKLHMFGSVKWNSKKWRMLLHFSSDQSLVFAGRQYPFGNDSILSEIKKVLETLGLTFETPTWKETHEEEYETRYIDFKNTITLITDIISDCDFPCHYNDLLYSSYYTNPYYLISDVKKDLTVNIGERVYCLLCGKELVEPEEGTLLCDKCDSLVEVYCDGCHRAVENYDYDEDLIHTEEGYTYCPECAEKLAHTCDVCGGYYNYETLRTYGELDYICPYCYEQLNKGE